jgi:hypothetical protein
MFSLGASDLSWRMDAWKSTKKDKSQLYFFLFSTINNINTQQHWFVRYTYGRYRKFEFLQFWWLIGYYTDQSISLRTMCYISEQRRRIQWRQITAVNVIKQVHSSQPLPSPPTVTRCAANLHFIYNRGSSMHTLEIYMGYVKNSKTTNAYHYR